MKRSIPFALALILFSATCIRCPAQGTNVDWFTDMDLAMQQAQAENKDLLLDFTGTDWCTWCIRLHDEVFQKSEFETVEDHFVLVQLDFPRDESKLSPEIRRQNEAWQQKLGVDGFPTIYLLDAEGRPYAKTGYRDGGVGPYLAHLEELRRVRKARDEAFAAAKAAVGHERARYLHEGLSSMTGNFVVSHYRDEVNEIVALDAGNQVGLKTKYEDLLAVADAQQTATEISLRVHELLSEQKRQEASELLQQELDKTEDNRVLRHRLQVIALRGGLLRVDNADETIRLLAELVESPYVDDALKPDLQWRRANALANAGKPAEAMLQIDEMIASMDSSEAKARVYFMKAQMLSMRGMHDEALAAYDDVLALLEEGSDGWITAQVSKANTLVELKRPREAIELLSDILVDMDLEVPVRCHIMATKAQALLASGDHDMAVETARSAKESLAAHAEADGTELTRREAGWREMAGRLIEYVLERADGGR